MAVTQTALNRNITPVPCPASAATVVKATPGYVRHLSIAGTGTAGTVALENTGTVLVTYGVPAAVTGFGISFPGDGVFCDTGIKVTTTGTGVTAMAAIS